MGMDRTDGGTPGEGRDHRRASPENLDPYDITRFVEGLTSANEEVLKQALQVVNERAMLERERGATAERRAGTVTVAIGVLAGFVVLAADQVAGTQADALNLMSGTAFAIVLVFLGKATFYVLKTLDLAKPYGLDHRLAEEIQTEDRLEALRLEIGWRRWEIEEMIPPNTQRLFWLSRALRNTSAAMLTLLVLGLILVFQGQLPDVAIAWGGSVLLLAGFVGAFGLDVYAEAAGFWDWTSG